MNKILEIKSVSKRFGGVQALDNVSIHLNEGEVLALAGDNGAGKSTLIKVVSGVYHPDNGDIIFKNEKTCVFQKSANNTNYFNVFVILR